MRSLITIGIFGLFLGTWLGCSQSNVAGTETGNPGEVVGVVQTSSGEKVSDVNLTLFPKDYNAAIADSSISLSSVTTNQDGSFHFADIGLGEYNLLAVNPTDNSNILIKNIIIDKKETIDLNKVILESPGTIVLSIEEIEYHQEGYIFIPGTPFYQSMDSSNIQNGQLVLENVPNGEYPNVTIANEGKTDTIQIIKVDTVIVESKDTVTLGPYFSWPYKKKVVINTSSTGGDVIEDMFSFPLLVRLDENNFAFNQADPDGKDIRFTNASDVSLDYEIEHWDSSNRSGVIWVRVDRIQGNNDSQYIVIHWGNEDAEDKADGKKVFSNNFIGVYHLDEDGQGVGSEGLYQNSAEDANHGVDSIISNNKLGLIGRGQYFNDSDLIKIPNVTNKMKPELVTMSAWIKTITVNKRGGEIVTMGTDYGMRVNNDGTLYVYNFTRGGPVTNLSSNDSILLDDQWHYVTGVVSGNTTEIYIDGELNNISFSPLDSINYAGTPDFYIGSHAFTNEKNDWNFIGSMDEVRVSQIERSKDWIRLCYKNQMANQDVVSVVELP